MTKQTIRRLTAVPLCLGLFTLFCAADWRDALRGLPEKAEQQYKAENYEKALQLYQESQTRNPDSDTLAYNLGNTLYKLGRFNDAAGQFGRILEKDSTSLSPQTMYNMGNTLFNMGKESSNQELLNQALEAFKHSIVNDPADEDAKYNYEVTKRLIQEQEQQQQQQQQDQQNEDKDQEQEDQQEQQQQDNQEQQEEEKQEQNQQQQQEQQPKPEEKQPQPQPGEMSEEEAEKILQALMQMEKEAREQEEKKKQQPASGAGGRDW